MSLVTLIDYGLGNIKAIQNMYLRQNISVDIASTPLDLLKAKHLILPGVGSFDWAMNRLNSSGLRKTLDNLVLKKGIPTLGICVGMQIMSCKSEEGISEGLSWIDSSVKKFAPYSKEYLNQVNRVDSKIILPHMGWNTISATSVDNALISGLNNASFYFLHSYYFKPSNSSYTIALTSYNHEFTSIASKGNIHGVQFHPEKSHHNGSRLLRNFSAFT